MLKTRVPDVDVCPVTMMIVIRSSIRVKSGKFGHQVNSDTRLQTVEIQMRRHIRNFHCLLS